MAKWGKCGNVRVWEGLGREGGKWGNGLSHEGGFLVGRDTAAEDVSLGEEGFGLFVEGVFFVVNDLNDAGVNNHFGARETWTEGDIDGSTLCGDAMVSGLCNGIFLGMGADTLAEGGARGGVAGTSCAATIHAVSDASWGSIIAR